jgi:hypothetical protein
VVETYGGFNARYSLNLYTIPHQVKEIVKATRSFRRMDEWALQKDNHKQTKAEIAVLGYGGPVDSSRKGKRPEAFTSH